MLSIDCVNRGDGCEEADGKVLVFARPTAELVQQRDEPHFRYGDELELTGKLEEAPALGNFDYGAYLENQGIHATMSRPQVRLLADQARGNPALRLIYRVRREVPRGIDRALPEPQSSLAQALLLGLRDGISRDVTEDFRSSGTSHLLAISGLHVGVLLALSLGTAAWLMGRRKQLYLLLPLVAIWLYALVSGLSPSVERAAIMGSVYLLALALGRPRSILPALGLAAAVMTGIEPQVLRQVSFQLSFTAVAGIAILTTSRWAMWDQLSAGGGAWWKHPARALAVAAAISAVATLATLPLIAFYFQRVPTVGIPATILALLAIPFVLVTSAASGIAGVASSGAGQVLGWVAWVPLEYVLRLVDLISRVPGSTVSVPPFSGSLVWAYYGAFALVILRPVGPRGLWERFHRTVATLQERAGREGTPLARLRFPLGTYLVAVVGLAVLTAFLWYHLVTGPDGKLHVHFLDVGQGDGTLIVTPEGGQVLVDRGPGPMEAARAVGDRLPFWDRNLDLVVLTHPDEDHFRGLVQVLDRYGVDEVLDSESVSKNPLYLEWQKAVGREEATPVEAYQGQTVLPDRYTAMEVLNPPPGLLRGTGSDKNNNGIVLRLAYGDVSFLLTADIEAEAEERLLRENLPLGSTVLKVSHHGSKTSSTARFLSDVSPVAAVISAGEGNPHGHPHREVTDSLHRVVGAERLYLTSERGDIEFITDGERLWVKTER